MTGSRSDSLISNSFTYLLNKKLNSKEFYDNAHYKNNILASWFRNGLSSWNTIDDAATVQVRRHLYLEFNCFTWHRAEVHHSLKYLTLWKVWKSDRELQMTVSRSRNCLLNMVVGIAPGLVLINYNTLQNFTMDIDDRQLTLTRFEFNPVRLSGFRINILINNISTFIQ